MANRSFPVTYSNGQVVNPDLALPVRQVIIPTMMASVIVVCYSIASQCASSQGCARMATVQRQQARGSNRLVAAGGVVAAVRGE